MDARHRRSRAKLAAAVLELAAERPIDSISASEIATLADVNRSTFYAHASSPIALLESVLSEELEAIRRDHLDEVDPEARREATTSATRSVLRHIEKHSSIYERGLTAGSGAASLRPMLSAQFESSLRAFLAEEPASDDPLFAVIAGPFIANGAIGAIGSWLQTPAPRDSEAFLRSYVRLLPAWFPARVPDAPAAAEGSTSS